MIKIVRNVKKRNRHSGQILVLTAGMIFLLLAGSTDASSQTADLDTEGKAAIIDWIGLKLNEIYVFPEVAQKMEAHLKEKFKSGEYDRIANPRVFARQLTGDLIDISNDRHFNVTYAPEPSLRMQRPDPEEEKKRLEQRIRQWKYDNYEFKKVERLEGNVGYLRFDGFIDTLYAGDTAVAALQFLKHCDAVIIDLRYNGGGGADMIQLITSYFFEERTHINSWYERREDKTTQSWTSAYVPGLKLLDADLYILTSGRTFSAAEEFTYDLKNLGRATLVGETTGGGGHTVTYERNDALKIEFKIPNSRAINPVSGDNWEGKGITPDVACSADEAFDRAYLLALNKLHEKAGPEGNKKQWLKWLMEYTELRLEPASVSAGILQSYAGTYGPARVVFENGSAWIFEPGARTKRLLIPVSENLFLIDGNADIRVEFVKDEGGNVTEAVAHFFDGSKNRIPKKK